MVEHGTVGRRVNRANVDPNRNFVWTPAELDAATNPDYARLMGLLNPTGPISRFSRGAFLTRVVRAFAAVRVIK